VNGAAGVVAVAGGRLYVVTGFTVRGGKIVAIDIIADPARLRQIDLGSRRNKLPLRPCSQVTTCALTCTGSGASKVGGGPCYFAPDVTNVGLEPHKVVT
jgi:hypothetical protein